MSGEGTPSNTGFHVRFLFWFCLLFAFFFLLTLPDYGITWDSAAAEFYVGDKYYWFYKTLDPDFLDFSKRNIPVYSDPKHPDFSVYTEYVLRRPHHIWSLGPIASAFTKDFFFTKLRLLDPIDAHHVSLGFFFLALAIALYCFVARYVGKWAAACTLISLAVMPRFWADLHNNIKDVPATVLFSLSVMGFYHSLRVRSIPLLLATGIVWGLGLATKANVMLVPLVLLLPAITLWIKLRADGARSISLKMCLALLCVPALAFSSFLLAWPYMFSNFPEGLQKYFEYLRKAGEIGPEAWQVLPLIKAVATTPLTILFAAAVGFIFFGARALFIEDRSFPLLVVVWFVVPILRVSLPGAYHIDGIRHYLEYTVPLAIMCGSGMQVAFSWIREMLAERIGPRVRCAAAFGLLLVYFSPLLYWHYKNHPYQICYFNPLIGGLKGAQDYGINDATDYWGSSYRQGYEWLNVHAPKNSQLVTGVGEHITGIVSKIWLRPDIRLARVESLEALMNEHAAGSPELPKLFVMYITRAEWYTSALVKLDKEKPPIFEVNVDGGSILRIIEL